MAKKIDYAAMFTLRKDGRYMARYTDKYGRHCIYDRDPEQLFHKLQEAQTNEPKPVTFRAVAEDWERTHREEIENRTWNNYRPHYNNILELHGSKPIGEVTTQDIINHLTTAKAQGYSATIVVTIRSIYRMIFDHAIAYYGAQYNPAVSTRLPKGLKRGKRSAPDDDVIKIICANIDHPFGLFPYFLLCTGLRKSEALALTWKDIDFKNREITISKSLDYEIGAKPKEKDPKTGAGFRSIPITDDLYDILVEKRKVSDSDYLFPKPASNRGGAGGGAMSLRCYEGEWLRYCKAVGLARWDEEDKKWKPIVTAHNFRHGTATILFESGADELATQRILGHARIETTRAIYTDLRDAQKKKSVRKFNKEMKKYAPSRK